FLDFTGRWDEWLSLIEQAEAKAIEAGDQETAGWRARDAAWIHDLRKDATGVLRWADRAEAHWKTANAGARERAIAIEIHGRGLLLGGDFTGAITAYRDALDLYRSVSTEADYVATCMISLANAEAALRDFPA